MESCPEPAATTEQATTAPDATAPATTAPDATAPEETRLGAELRRWLTAAPGHAPDGFTLAWLVTAQIRTLGRQHLGTPLLTALAAVQARHRPELEGQPDGDRDGDRDGDVDGRNAYLGAFLDAVLARHQGRFSDRTYLGLPLLALLAADPSSGMDPARLSALLMADVICHEHRPESAGPLDAVTRGRRTRHAARFITEIEPTLGDAVPTRPGTAAGDWLALTVLPVSTVHDEYFFIRALQAHELVFEALTAEVREATAAARDGYLDRAAAAVRSADRVFRRAAALLRMVATIRPADFHDFSRYTEDASAIRSEAYRSFELACAELVSADGPDEELADLRRAMGELEASHQEWRSAQHDLADRLLGDRLLADAPGGFAEEAYMPSSTDTAQDRGTAAA